MKQSFARWLIAMLLMMGIVLTGCGGAQQPASDQNTSSAPATEEEAPANTETENEEAPANTETEDEEAPANTETEDEEAPADAEDEEAPADTEESMDATDEMTDTESMDATDEMTNTDETAMVAPTFDEEFTFAMVLVGPYNDAGWSQAHYEGARYAEERITGSKFIYVDKVNAADRPNVTVEQVVDDFVEQGAKLIITNSDDFKDGTLAAAEAHPETYFVHISGDSVLTGDASENLSNVMGKMIYGKMIAGCAAALQSETGKISYLGPLINDETRRLVNAVYLGANYCNENLRETPFADGINFEVVWIGFWFNIPGVTLDPTQVANNFINAGSDVIVSGIDTTEALVEAGKSAEAGKNVYAIPYDYRDACSQAEEVCLGVPYFNWGPDYIQVIADIANDEWSSTWEWNDPDWSDINNIDTSPVGFLKGQALSEENQAKLDTFIEGLADGSINLFVGPINYQDGSVYLEDGEEATDEQMWYAEQLLEGIKGESSAE